MGPNGPRFEEFILDKQWTVNVTRILHIILKVMGFGLFHLERGGDGDGVCIP
jgi:hypothetical protein